MMKCKCHNQEACPDTPARQFKARRLAIEHPEIREAHQRVLEHGVPPVAKVERELPPRGSKDRFPLDPAPQHFGPWHPDMIAKPMDWEHLPAWGGDANKHRKLVERASINRKLDRLQRPHSAHAGGCSWLHPTFGDCDCGEHARRDRMLPVPVRTEHHGD